MSSPFYGCPGCESTGGAASCPTHGQQGYATYLGNETPLSLYLGPCGHYWDIDQAASCPTCAELAAARAEISRLAGELEVALREDEATGAALDEVRPGWEGEYADAIREMGAEIARLREGNYPKWRRNDATHVPRRAVRRSGNQGRERRSMSDNTELVNQLRTGEGGCLMNMRAAECISGLEQQLAALRAENETLKRERDEVDTAIPKTFYGGLPISKRVEFLATQWNRVVNVNKTLERERDALAADPGDSGSSRAARRPEGIGGVAGEHEGGREEWREEEEAR
jgi:hypothetical protein